ncbi:MAG: hypothetical protein MJ187_03780 [Alphaproteobacteria bacterium]|nr:hypothetical protein [Alphaproteobacteria bacterium]
MSGYERSLIKEDKGSVKEYDEYLCALSYIDCCKKEHGALECMDEQDIQMYEAAITIIRRYKRRRVKPVCVVPSGRQR